MLNFKHVYEHTNLNKTYVQTDTMKVETQSLYLPLQHDRYCNQMMQRGSLLSLITRCHVYLLHCLTGFDLVTASCACFALASFFSSSAALV
jgi:hypothetical protein